MSDIQPGTWWRDRRPATGPQQPDWRRVVQVISSDGWAVSNSRVLGFSFWQRLEGGIWVTQSGPGHKRRTSILRAAFLGRFEPLGTEPASTDQAVTS